MNNLVTERDYATLTDILKEHTEYLGYSPTNRVVLDVNRQTEIQLEIIRRIKINLRSNIINWTHDCDAYGTIHRLSN